MGCGREKGEETDDPPGREETQVKKVFRRVSITKQEEFLEEDREERERE